MSCRRAGRSRRSALAAPRPAGGWHRPSGVSGRRAGRIAEEVITHLAGLVGARVQVTLEIEANVPDGVPEQVVRVLLENGMTLGFEEG